MAALFAVLILMSCVQTQKRPDSPQPSPQLTTPATLFLDVQGPIDGVTVEGDAVVVHGATSPGATLSINGAVVSVGSDGSFKVEVSLLAGPNIIEVVASRVPGSGVRGRGSGERETTASSLAGKEESSRKKDNSGQGKDGPAGAIAQGGNGRSRVPGSGVRGRGSGEGETTASSLAGKEESSRKEDNSGQGKDGPAGAIAQGGNGQ